MSSILLILMLGTTPNCKYGSKDCKPTCAQIIADLAIMQASKDACDKNPSCTLKDYYAIQVMNLQTEKNIICNTKNS